MQIAGLEGRCARWALLATGLLLVASCSSTPPPALQSPPEDAFFAFRDPRTGAQLLLSDRQKELLDEALGAFRRGNRTGAERLFRKGVSRGPAAPFELGLAYLAVSDERREDARAILSRLTAVPRPLPAALEAEADLHAAEGELREALDGYRVLLRVLPGDRRAEDRLAAVRRELVQTRQAEAEEALQARNLDTARRAGVSLVEIDPASPAGFQVLARAAEAGAKLEDAYVWAMKARSLAPQDAAWTEVVADYAMRTRRYTDAIALYDELAIKEPSFRARADGARLEFEIQNLPEPAQRAARSTRLARAQAAVLLWWLVTEVREAPQAPVAEVAVDVVDRGSRTALVRAIALGFFSVSRESHRVGAESPVSRTEMASLLRRLALFLSRRPLPSCLVDDPPAPAALAECGILAESSSRFVTGKEAVRAIQRAARAGREGGPR